MSDLATTQRRLWRLLTAPDGVAAALADAGDAEGLALEGWLGSDARATASTRLEIYAHAYFQRIHDVLARDLPTLAAALGADGFHDLAAAYLCVHPPSRPSLRHAGARLPGFLATDAAAAPFRRRWPFAADLARLEWALGEAFDAPDAPPLARAELEALAPERWETLALAPHPSVRRLSVGWNVAALRAAFEADDEDAAGAALPSPEAGDATLLVWRSRERVRFRALDADEADLLARLATGATFGALCEAVARRHGPDEAPARAAARLAAWLDAELLVRG
ncbi:MAG TPA: DNA-binding domain-containing protein [Myxococcota bacterium]|nr:DNA-binding domain-containing protein [Myxococcota bacterium]